MQKVLAKNRFSGYTLGMKDKLTTMIPTAKPQFRNADLITQEIDTTAKITQADAFFKHYATKDFTVHLQYGQTHAYKAGDQVNLEKCGEGFALLDGYGCHVIDAIEADGVKTDRCHVVPADWVTSRQFCIVREYKTTIWEIV